MSKKMRAKFVIIGVEVSETCERVSFSAVSKSTAYPADGSDEDNTYAHYSPSANCSITIANPALHGVYKAGQKFYVDFTPVPEPVPATA
jgi:hypothetical protein